MHCSDRHAASNVRATELASSGELDLVSSSGEPEVCGPVRKRIFALWHESRRGAG